MFFFVKFVDIKEIVGEIFTFCKHVYTKKHQKLHLNQRHICKRRTGNTGTGK